jgi:hypothetical protein
MLRREAIIGRELRIEERLEALAGAVQANADVNAREIELVGHLLG